jgi:hypothetical protein
MRQLPEALNGFDFNFPLKERIERGFGVLGSNT